MATRAQRNQGDRDEDAAAPAIALNVLGSLVTAVTQAITTAIANTKVPVHVALKIITYSSAYDPYDKKLFKTKTKEGKHRWHLITKTAEGRRKDGICATVEHADKILDLLKNCSVQFGLDNIMNIPTSGTGSVHATPQTIVGVDHWNADVRNYINILTSYHQLSLDQFRAFSVWFMGNKTSTLTKSSDMQINAINKNKDGNLGLLNWYKIGLQHISGALHFILKNHVYRTS